MSTIRRALKMVLLRIGDAALRGFVPATRGLRLRRALRVSLLAMSDAPAAAVEVARDLGVTVGQNCRFYGVHWGHEPFLVEIGDDVLLAFGVRFVNHDSGVYMFRNEANDVVNSFPDDCVIMGNPARVVFPTSFYREMKLFSDLTVHNAIAFPEFDFLPEEERKRIILAQIGDVPIRPPHLGRRGRVAD